MAIDLKKYIVPLVIFMTALTPYTAVLVCRFYCFDIVDLGGFFYLGITFFVNLIIVFLMYLFSGKRLSEWLIVVMTAVLVFLVNPLVHNILYKKDVIPGWYYLSADFNFSKTDGELLCRMFSKDDVYDDLIYDANITYPGSRKQILFILQKEKEINPEFYHQSKMVFDLLFILSKNYDENAVSFWREIIAVTEKPDVRSKSVKILKDYHNISYADAVNEK